MLLTPSNNKFSFAHAAAKMRDRSVEKYAKRVGKCGRASATYASERRKKMRYFQRDTNRHRADIFLHSFKKWWRKVLCLPTGWFFFARGSDVVINNRWLSMDEPIMIQFDESIRLSRPFHIEYLFIYTPRIFYNQIRCRSDNFGTLSLHRNCVIHHQAYTPFCPMIFLSLHRRWRSFWSLNDIAGATTDDSMFAGMSLTSSPLTTDENARRGKFVRKYSTEINETKRDTIRPRVSKNILSKKHSRVRASAVREHSRRSLRSSGSGGERIIAKSCDGTVGPNPRRAILVVLFAMVFWNIGS